MKKLSIVALLLAAAMVLSGCSLISVNQDRKAKQAAATVNGIAIERQTVEREAKNSYDYMYGLYQNGWTESDLKAKSEAKEWYKDLLNTTLDQLVSDQVMLQKAGTLGITLTDEEKAEQKKASDDAFTNLMEQARTAVEEEAGINASPAPDGSASPEASPAASPEASPSASPAASPEASASPSPTATLSPDLEAAVQAKYEEYVENSGFTSDSYYEYLCSMAIINKAADYMKNQAAVSDEDAKKWYDDTLTAQQAEMDKTPSVFTTDVTQGLIYTYVPEDTIAVKHVLLKYKDADLSAVAQQMYIDGKKDEAMALLKGQIEELMPLALEIQSKLEKGESIDELIKQYGEDDGMKTAPYSTYGYLIGASTTGYVSEFMEAALKLTTKGDVSAPVETYFGLHILQSINVYNKGVIPFDDIKEQIKEALLPNKQTDKYNELLEQWKGEAKISYDRDRLFN